MAETIAGFFGGAEWLATLLPWGTLALLMGISVFLILPIISAITSLFLGEIAAAVENRHYPHARAAGQGSMWVSLRDMIGFFGVLILANLAVLMCWFIIPFFAPFIYYAANGYLLGREYFQMLGARHMARADYKEMYRRYGLKIWMTGGVMALLMTVPILNLFIPILAAASFTHLFHQLRASD